MAVQTKQYARISAHSQLVFVVYVDYQDDDWQTINDDGDPDDFRVVRWHGTNHSAFPHTVTAYRPNGAVWGTRTVLAGSTFTVPAGGAVKYESDIPRWTYS